MQFLSNIAQFLLVTGIAFVVLTGIASFLRFQNIARQRSETDRAVDSHDLFQVQLARRLGTANREPQPFLVMVLAPDNVQALATQSGGKIAEEQMDALKTRVQGLLREGDTVARQGEDRIGIAVDSVRENAEVIARRIVDGVQREPLVCVSGRMPGVSVSLGIASHPENGNRVKILLGKAIDSLQAVLQTGRGQFELTPVESEPRAPTPMPAPGEKSGSRTDVDQPDRAGAALQKYVERHRKQGEPVSVLTIEIDPFTRDAGHDGASAGDGLLRKVGENLQQVVRKSDLIGRAAGENFVLAMNCSPHNAMAVAQRILDAAKKIGFPVGGGSWSITFSIGVAGSPDHAEHPRHLLEAATVALEAAKEKGRNRCLMYDSSMRIKKQGGGPMDVF